MEKTKERDRATILFIALAVILAVLGYALGNMDRFNPITLGNDFWTSVFHPFPPRHLYASFMMITIFEAMLGVGYIFYVIKREEMANYRHFNKDGERTEFDDNHFIDPVEANELLEDSRSVHKNMILSEHVRVAIDARKRQVDLNSNVVIIGGPGSGKSFFYVKPNALNCECSYIFCDPKGELLRDTGKVLEQNGYRVRVLNLVDLDQSDGYNPFEYIRSDEDITKLITNLVQNTTPKGANKGDPFWEKSESMLLSALMKYVWYEHPRVGRTPSFRGVLELLNQAKVSDEGEESDLDKIMYALPPDHPALVDYKKVASGAADTIRSIIISAHSRLAYMQSPKVLRLLDNDEMDIRFLGQGVYNNPDRPMALFCVIPDNDKTLNFIVGMLYTQIFQELYYVADNLCGNNDGRLPIHVSFWMDEFANVALPEGFLEILATCRSREISCKIIIQNLAQLKTLFKDSWETVLGNCSTFIYLGGNEQSTYEYVSKLLGKYTLGKRSSSQSLGKGGGGSNSFDVISRELMTPAEVGHLDPRKCIIKIAGMYPILDWKYMTYNKPEAQLMKYVGKYTRHRNPSQENLDELDYYLIPSLPAGIDEKCRSFRYMIENYNCIFEESKIYEERVPIGDGEYFRLTDAYGGYYDANRRPSEPFYPAFESIVSDTIQSGQLTLKQHTLVGFFYESSGLKLIKDLEKAGEAVPRIDGGSYVTGPRFHHMAAKARGGAA